MQNSKRLKSLEIMHYVGLDWYDII